MLKLWLGHQAQRVNLCTSAPGDLDKPISKEVLPVVSSTQNFTVLWTQSIFELMPFFHSQPDLKVG